MSRAESGERKAEMSSPIEPKLPSDAKRISESIEGIMRQLIVNAEEDEELVLEVAIEAGVPKNPIRTGANKNDSSKQPEEYFVWGYFNPTPKVPRAYQFTRVITSKGACAAPSDVTSERTSSTRKSQQKVESMTSTEYSHLESDSSSRSEKASLSSQSSKSSHSSEASGSTTPSTSELFPKALVQRAHSSEYDH